MNEINCDIKPELLFELAKQETGTRGYGFKIRKKHTRLRLRQSSFSITIVNTWNSLPTTVVNAITMNQFKNGIDDALSTTIDMYNYGTGRLWQQESVVY